MPFPYKSRAVTDDVCLTGWQSVDNGTLKHKEAAVQVDRLQLWAPMTFRELRTRWFSWKALSLTFQSAKWVQILLSLLLVL